MPQTRGTRFSAAPRVSSLLLGFAVASGALLVAPQTPHAWAAPLVGGDENGPKVQIISPAYQDVLKGRSRILIGVKATKFNPSTIQLFIDGKADDGAMPLTSFASSSFNWDTRNLSDGLHKLSVRVTDTQGFVGWAEVSVHINNNNLRDTVAPEIKWGNVQAYQQLSGQARVALDAKDNFGVKWIIVSLNSLDKTKQQSTPRSWVLSRPPYAFDLDTTKVTDGLYVLSARAWDAMEQEGQSKSLTVGVVNSPVNATTIGESLESLKAAEAAQNKNNPPSPQPKTNFVPETPAPVADSHSGGAASAKNAKPKPDSPAKVPSDYTLIPDTGEAPAKTGVEIARNPSAPVGTPTLSNRSAAQRKGAASNSASVAPSVPTAAPVPTDSTPEATTGTRVARLSQPEAAPRAIESTSVAATLSSRNASTDVLAPSLSSDTATSTESASVPAVDPVRIARLNQPEITSRHETQGNAALTQLRGMAEAHSAPVAPTTDSVTPRRVEYARPTQPGTTRSTGLSPVLSAPLTSTAGVLSGVQKVRPGLAANPGRRTATGTKRNADRVSSMSKVKSHNPQLRRETPIFGQAPDTKNKSLIAGLPRTTNPVEVAPTPSIVMEHPSITVSPIKAAFNKSLPAFHMARAATSLRTIADHYGLPLQLVAAANKWETNMNVLPGMVVQLPRQVQLSVDGQPVKGDVSSLVAGDTSFTAMRFLFEHTGGKITWDAAKKEVIATKGNSTIHVKIGSKFASVNNKQVMMQLAAFLFEGRTMVPSRFFEEGLNAQVEWDPQTGNMVVAMAG